MAERLNAAVSKTVTRASGSEVRILVAPKSFDNQEEDSKGGFIDATSRGIGL